MSILSGGGKGVYTELVCCEDGGMRKAIGYRKGREEVGGKLSLNILVIKDLSEETHEKEVKIRKMRRL